VPTCEETAGQGAVDLARAYGVPLDAWQEDIVRGILRETGGTWSASQAGLVVGRQNGNGQVLLALELYGLLVLGEQVLHTAHAVKTFSDAFRRLWAVMQTHDGPASSVRRHSQRIGAEYVELVSGAWNAFTTRSASAGRGLAVDRLVVDEAEGLPAPGGRRARPDRVLPAARPVSVLRYCPRCHARLGSRSPRSVGPRTTG
jgi:hypothetical protein